MICTKCGKKIETNGPCCKYCKEPVVTEGVSPLNVTVTKEREPEETLNVAPQSQSFVDSDGKKKFMIMASGALCGLVVLFVLASFLLFNKPESHKEKKNTSEPSEGINFFDEDFDKKESKKQKSKENDGIEEIIEDITEDDSKEDKENKKDKKVKEKKKKSKSLIPEINGSKMSKKKKISKG